ncbi:hypothetical protein L208DRAFT_1385386 [Tricholoma matsutake]|nr:hypothetical protein L208DRAFT_1385386 [Tricholoma matsutake 945]
MLLKLFSWGPEHTLYSTEEEHSDEEESDSDTDDVNEENFVHQLDRQDLIRIANGQKKLMSAWLSAVSLSDVNCALKTPCNSNKARITLDVMVSARSRLEEGYGVLRWMCKIEGKVADDTEGADLGEHERLVRLGVRTCW